MLKAQRVGELFRKEQKGFGGQSHARLVSKPALQSQAVSMASGS
ncbi:hypothetical protein U716_03265 [Rhodobacter capsulatus B6]|nr:hypothetical protein U716_03265 [Rhodobacter capsulatus B6]